MAARTGLKESLQEISALMGLLRSDLLELSGTPLRSGGPATVVSHMHWIADRFDELGPALSADIARRPSQPGKSTDRRHAPPSRTRTGSKTKRARAPSEHPAAPLPAPDNTRQAKSPVEQPASPEPAHPASSETNGVDVARPEPSGTITRDES